MTAAAIEFRDVTKVYGSTVAVARFSHAFAPGRVHALMGKNGSGKSTLVKMLAGAIEPTLGELWVGGRRVRLASPRDAFAAGIVTVHQELSLVRSLSVGENIYLGRLPHRRLLGRRIVDWRRLRREATALLADMGLAIDPATLVESLSVGQQQIIEIVKAMSFGPAILLLDEPTSALAAPEVAQLFALVRRLRERGVTMIYITHRINELFDIADTCTVLRDGRFTGSIPMREATAEAIVEMMFGGIAKAVRPLRRAVDRSRPILKVRGLSRSPAIADISFDLYRGEVLGFAGLLGSGRTEVLRAIFGADGRDAGEIVFDEEEVRSPSPRLMKRRGLGYTPENRKEVGLVQVLSSHTNLCLASFGRIARHGVISERLEAPFVRRQIADLHISVPDPRLPVSSLSGGNQQKIVIGNWLNTAPKVMFFDEPSRGIDVQAKQQVFEIMWQQAERGLSSIFVSSELEEVLEVADRILVLYHGRLVAEVFPETTTLAQLYRICIEGSP
jgi:ABC-type sugar transport system ATPase subunit